MSLELRMGVGDCYSIKRGVLKGTLSLIYSGMPSEKVFALSPIWDESTFQDGFKFAPTIFYPSDSTRISVLGDQFDVLSVRPDEITLRYLSPKEA